MKLFENNAKIVEKITYNAGGVFESKKIEKELYYYHVSDRIDEIYRKIDLTQAHMADKKDRVGIGARIRLSPRRQLEGFEFLDIAHEKGPIWAKGTTLQEWGKVWIDMVRANNTITISAPDLASSCCLLTMPYYVFLGRHCLGAKTT